MCVCVCVHVPGGEREHVAVAGIVAVLPSLRPPPPVLRPAHWGPDPVQRGPGLKNTAGPRNISWVGAGTSTADRRLQEGLNELETSF